MNQVAERIHARGQQGMMRALLGGLLAVGTAFTPAMADLSPDALALLPDVSVIDFDTITGYDVTPISGNWVTNYIGGGSRHRGYGWSNYAYLALTRPEGQDLALDYTGTIEVTKNDVPFYFESAKIYTYVLDSPFDITGWLDGQQVYSTSGVLSSNPFISTGPRYNNPYASSLIDKLEIRFTSPGMPGCDPSTNICPTPGTEVIVQEIFVRRAVPEPTSVALMMAGMLVVTGGLRKRRAV